MNRCIEFASGDYLCIWNVDDLRTPDSIEVMAKTLDDNPDIEFVYGNYTIVPNFGNTEGEYVDETGRENELTTGYNITTKILLINIIICTIHYIRHTHFTQIYIYI